MKLGLEQRRKLFQKWTYQRLIVESATLIFSPQRRQDAKLFFAPLPCPFRSGGRLRGLAVAS